ncbi:MAG: aminopeptidase N [Rhodobacterales bacterium]|nr:aminopeptidase N [Rhodobacterales bacterium]
MSDAPTTVFLADYQPFTHLVLKVALTFRLAPTATRVLAHIQFAPNPARPGHHALRLDGEGLRLLSLRIDGRPAKIVPDATGLTIPAKLVPVGAFTIETEVEIDPETNTALEGLYMSKGMYCTQCEAEGFRKITYYPDRPDVMARFKVRVEGNQPVLLSNGNPVAKGKAFAEWDDPWPKPAYLFALVAGDLRARSGTFRTFSGRKVKLNIWVRPGDEGRCAYALDSLIRSMKWEEEVYGREYDLDVFNIVAVDDFNMGAMENKGLNIFNSRYVLASPETATDDDYARIEAIVAHEYFHNWTGNRITCRDWFQLCLKEGLTVFRDHQFSGDMRSAAVRRIEDVVALRARQFREDAGPLAHPVRPESFVEINNFYTSTIYEKGAEVIGMLKSLVGDASYKRALDLYFDRHDGDAATIEDWLKVFEDATGRDLTQFRLWYSQAGTPVVRVTEDWQDGVFTLTFTQTTPARPGEGKKAPQVIPIKVGLLNPNGDEVVPTIMLEMTESRQSFRFDGLATRPVPSILRGFSAPVVLDRKSPPEERAFLLAHDTDPFNKWEAGRALAKDVMAEMVQEGTPPATIWLDALAAVTFDETLDPAFRALCLRLPGEDDMAQTIHALGRIPDPARIHAARREMAGALAIRLGEGLGRLYAALDDGQPFTPSAAQAGRRALRLAALALISRRDGGKLAARACKAARSMTEEIGALSSLLSIGQGQAELADFAGRWGHDANVMDKWFALQIGHAEPAEAAALTELLCQRPDFDWKNPNRFRSVIGAFAANHAGFHHLSGAGYRLVADWLIRLDPLNPQTAARMSTAFETWPRYGAARRKLARAELRRVLDAPGLSGDLQEMVERMLKAG